MKDFDIVDMNEVKKIILDNCDLDCDGRISKNELRLILFSFSNL